MLAALGILAGLMLLIGGGAALVTGASQLATRAGVPPMVIGLTIVGFGTSSPELIINLIGVSQGETELAFGNIVGSNISNLALILGTAGLIGTITLQGQVMRREVPLLLLVTTITAVLALDGYFESLPARISRADSIVLLLLFLIFVYITGHDFLRGRDRDALVSQIDENPIVASVPRQRYAWLQLFAGFALLFIGGEVTVRNAVALASQLGFGTALVGLFVVAVGTSMPELVTSIIAALRKESDLALGNVVGSNIFNSLIVLPASGFVAPIAVPDGGVLDLAVSWLFAAALLPIFVLGRARLGRPVAILLLVTYFSYVAYRVSTAT